MCKSTEMVFCGSLCAEVAVSGFYDIDWADTTGPCLASLDLASGCTNSVCRSAPVQCCDHNSLHLFLCMLMTHSRELVTCVFVCVQSASQVSQSGF